MGLSGCLMYLKFRLIVLKIISSCDIIPGAFSLLHKVSRQTVSVGLGLVQSCFGSSDSALILLDNWFKLDLLPEGHRSAILSYLQSENAT